MEREMASTAPISQPDQYMMVTTRQTTPLERRGRERKELKQKKVHVLISLSKTQILTSYLEFVLHFPRVESIIICIICDVALSGIINTTSQIGKTDSTIQTVHLGQQKLIVLAQDVAHMLCKACREL